MSPTHSKAICILKFLLREILFYLIQFDMYKYSLIDVLIIIYYLYIYMKLNV